jgi:hypothetical protein
MPAVARNEPTDTAQAKEIKKMRNEAFYLNLRALATAVIPPVCGVALFVSAPAVQAEAPSCGLLKNAEVMSLISGPGERALKARCGQLPIQVPAAEDASAQEAIEPAIGADLPVNNRAADVGANFTQSEASVARYGNTLVAGFNDSGSLGGGDFSGYATSVNGGFTWTDRGAPTTPLGNVRGVFGDPVVEMDRRTSGPVRTYFANLGEAVNPAGRSIIAVHRSDNFGVGWLQAANASPLAAAGDFQDKEWMAVDPRLTTATGAGNVYVCWRRFGGLGGIQFSRSTNGGASFIQRPARLSANATNVQGCAVEVDPRNGRVYVAWSDLNSNQVKMRISNDFGVTFGAEFAVGSLLSLAETTANCGGSTRTVFLDSEAGSTTRAIRSSPFPSLAVNPRNGHVYVVWHRGGTVNNPDIAYARSTTGLAGSYVTTNLVTTARAQFFPTVAANRVGEVAVMYYSTQNSATNRRIDVYVRRSPDGVVFDAPVRITDVSFDRSVTNPNADPAVAACYMGDYNDVEAAAPAHQSTVFNYIWGDNRLLRNVGGIFRPDPDVRFDTD